MTTGIIAEYNPFHNGHKYMLKQIREQFPQEPIIICLSGSITQRGEMALLDKWTRAKLAVLGGANLVIELPAVYATASAEHFAFGGVKTLEALGCVDTLVFGSESGNLDELQRTAFILKKREDELLEINNKIVKINF